MNSGNVCILATFQHGTSTIAYTGDSLSGAATVMVALRNVPTLTKLVLRTRPNGLSAWRDLEKWERYE